MMQPAAFITITYSNFRVAITDEGGALRTIPIPAAHYVELLPAMMKVAHDPDVWDDRFMGELSEEWALRLDPDYIKYTHEACLECDALTETFGAAS